ncbi:MAG: hypothetical protein JO010_12270 [Alphaproteobacteria bacterium]|nr:hypothetical protein [Alphaproteobacteria bacterium]
MNVPKPMAALSGDLLARKGGAMPADLLFPYPIAAAPRVAIRMPALPLSAPAAPPPAASREQPSRRIAPPQGDPPRRRDSAAKVSLRLDPDRHQRLRLAAFHQGRSGQDIMIAALDAYLERDASDAREGACACQSPPDE